MACSRLNESEIGDRLQGLPPVIYIYQLVPVPNKSPNSITQLGPSVQTREPVVQIYIHPYTLFQIYGTFVGIGCDFHREVGNQS